MKKKELINLVGEEIYIQMESNFINQGGLGPPPFREYILQFNNFGDILESSFVWDKSDQGFDYWDDLRAEIR